MHIVSLQLCHSLSLAHAEPTRVVWSSAYRDDFSLWSSDNPSQIRLNTDSQVRVRLGASFAAHTKGMRQAWVIKNGQQSEPFFGYPTPTSLSVDGGSSTSLSATSPLVRHKAGDVFEMFVYQTSGEVLALRGAHATWIELEIHPIAEGARQ